MKTIALSDLAYNYLLDLIDNNRINGNGYHAKMVAKLKIQGSSSEFKDLIWSERELYETVKGDEK